MKKLKETKKQNLLRRLEENREFFMATRKVAYASFMEELIDYIKHYPSTIEEHAEAMACVIDHEILEELYETAKN